MKRALLLVAALAACDDPEVTGKVASVLEHGIVAGQLDCACELQPLVGGHFPYPIKYRAQRLLDGACFVDGVSHLWSRTEANAESCPTQPGVSGSLYLEGGELRMKQQLSDPPAAMVLSHSEDIETCCAGFNLEAFGVE